MIKVFYDGWGVVYDIKEDRRKGFPMASSDGFFCLMPDNERRLNLIGDGEIGVLAVIPDDNFCFLLTDEKGNLSPIKINKETDIHKHPTNGNALRLIFDDAPPVEPPVNQNKSEMLTAVNQASLKFWGNADKNDPDTWEKNQTVIDWLTKERGFSENTAKVAATIIRPEWAKK
jgi:hypothetical protein